MGRTSDARERLVESGRELMHERGYTAVGVSELCSQAGVQKGSFYHFFPSKLDLTLAVIDRFETESAEMMDALASGREAPLERLAAYGRRVHEHHAAARAACGKVLGCPIGNLALEMSAQEPTLRARLEQVFDRNVESFRRVVQEAIDRGDLEPRDARRTAASLLALVEGTIMQAKMHDDPEALSRLGEDLQRLAGARPNGTG